MIRNMVGTWCRKLGHWISGWLEEKLAVWPRGPVRLLVTVTGILAGIWCALMLGKSLYILFTHH